MNNATLNFIILGLSFLLLILLICGTILLILLNKNFQNKIILKKIKEIYEEYKLFECYKISTTFSWFLRIISLICILALCIYWFSIEEFVYAVSLISLVFVFMFADLLSPKIMSLERNSLIIRNALNTKRREYNIEDLEYIKIKIMRGSRRNSNLVLYLKTIFDKGIAQYPLSFQDWVNAEVLIYIIHFIKNNNTNAISELSLEDIQLLRNQYRKD